MSSWIHLNGMMRGVERAERAVVDDAGRPPRGSEGSASFRPLDPDKFPGIWTIHGDLRDLDEDDVPTIRMWFAAACRAAQPTEAQLDVDVEQGSRYQFVWLPVDGQVVLHARRHEQ